ncbi:type II toxin-antitoxin system YhaV family toxin [Legionella feeleii]|uniref:Toxin YhaV n=1 Tax=Legionella feeleii TaxID=453 RepID=A0A0W0U767_9GAMM|nr:type II toxin-antitoxin system YhaV family toxin [Legionella feeleii]KTD03579.1 Toxin YhaV [Legionella feeleii]SPX59378.1 Toxin YhaV [Legionella feeleii]
MSKLEGLTINGWSLFIHPVFLEQLEFLLKEVKKLRQKDPLTYKKKNSTKRLAAIAKLIFEVIPNDPTLAAYRQGSTLGHNYSHWHRVKFFQQYRLFFRYHLGSKVIIYAWVNDEDTKRAYDKKNDAYRVFSKMLQGGRPPDDWSQLLTESQNIEAITAATKDLLRQLKSAPL